MGTYGGPNIVTDGLTLHIDVANPKSYPGSGTTVYNLTPSYSSFVIAGESSLATFEDKYLHLDSSGLADTDGAFLLSTETISTTLNSDFTSMGWMYREDYHSAEILSYRQASQRLSFEILDSSLVFNQRETSSPFTTNSTSISITNARDVWDHFALSKTGTSWSFYKNGEHLGTNTFSMTETVGGSGIHIGAAWTDDDYIGRAMNGRVGPIMHYTRSLSEDEIIQNYLAIRSRFV